MSETVAAALAMFLRYLQDLVQQAAPAGRGTSVTAWRTAIRVCQLLNALLRQLAHIAERFAAAVDTAEDLLQCRATLLDDPPQHRHFEQRIGPLLLGEDDLRERHRGEVFAGVVVDDVQIVTATH